MEKKYALAISVIVTILIASDLYALNLVFQDSGREEAVIERVIDGDTLVLDDGRIVRLLNINSPEKGYPGSDLSKSFLQQFVNKSVEMQITGTDKYFRNLARIYSPEYINLEIVKQGYASKFLVDSSESGSFAKAEIYAINNSLGIWKKSPFFGCFKSSIDAKSETVIISNLCSDIDMEGWMLKDESRKVYVFKNNINSNIRLHSGDGKDNETDYYWKSSQDIWNNDRDSLYLFDSEGNIAHYQVYGY